MSGPVAAKQQTEAAPAVEQIAGFAANAQSGGWFFGVHASNHGRVMMFASGISLKRGVEVAAGIGFSGGDPVQDETARQGGTAVTKTGILLDAAKGSYGRVAYVLCDVSPEALDEAGMSIESLLPTVRLRPILGNYVTHPPQALSKRSQPKVGSPEFSKMNLAIGWKAVPVGFEQRPVQQNGQYGRRKDSRRPLPR